MATAAFSWESKRPGNAVVAPPASERAAPAGVETVDLPTDGQLIAFVRRYFRAADRMLGTAP